MLNEKVLSMDWIGSKGSIPSSYGLHALFSLPPLAPFFSSSLLSLIPFVKQSHGTIFNLGFTSLI